MKEKEFQSWCQKLKLLPEAIELINTIRTTPPSRQVQGRAGNVRGTYPSLKMGLTIQFESHKVELWAIYQMEHDQEVKEFYDQPKGFKIQYQNQSGRRIGHYHTPDFFVLRSREAGWEEWKTEAELLKLSEKYPTRYQKTENGIWQCPPGLAYAQQFGLKYYVRSNAQLDPVEIQNLMFLEDYVKFTANVPPQIQALVLERVKQKQAITIAEVLASSSLVRANELYGMIASEQLYVDLKASPLVDHSSVRLYSDKSTHDAYVNIEQNHLSQANLTKSNPTEDSTLFEWDGKIWKLVNSGETTTTLLPEQGQPIQLPNSFWQQLLETGRVSFLTKEDQSFGFSEVQALMSAASPKDLEQANYREHLVQGYLEGQIKEHIDISLRTLQRWVKQFKDAQINYGCGYVGLLPRTKKRGNRLPKAPQPERELLDTFIAEHFETPRQATASSVYLAYSRACEQQNLTALSRSTFYQRLSVRRSFEQISKRKGSKVAYNKSEWHWELTYSTPRHGDRPFAIVHIDHTQLDLELRSSSTGKLLGRPWLTLLIDAYSRRILAVYLTFDAPSYRACMMALRICVQRFGRFPQALVVDGGKEFHSVYFDTLLARYHCIKKTRPGAKPRFGSVIERLFATTNTQFVFNLLGNTQASKQPRTLTKTIDPKQLAVWTLSDLSTYLGLWAYSIYDTTEHPALHTTPRNSYEFGLSLTGEREHRRIPYSEEFLMATHPSTKSGLALIQPGRGIKLHYLYYWSDAFRNPEVERTKIPVRYDPFDVGVAYAYVQGRWVKCISQYYSIFSGRSEKELLLASIELKQLAKITREKLSISAKHLADFLANVQEHETLLGQRLRDLEVRGVLNALEVKPETMISSTMVRPTELTNSNVIKSREAEVFSTDVPTSDNFLVPSLELSSLPIFEEYR